jgi:predicted MPP superfamily phosphohydrolase
MNMVDVLYAAAVVIGHFALHLTIYNRLNATGLPRPVIKVIKWFFFGTAVAIPIAAWANGPPNFYGGWLAIYGVVCLLTLVIYGPRWLVSRPSLNRDAVDVHAEVKRVAIAEAIDGDPAVTRKCRLLSKVPGNQIFQLAIEAKTLEVAGLPAALDGLKIAHLSDIHLTGHVSPAFYRYVLRRAVEWEPDLVAMTGDIIDKRKCLDWLPDCFAHSRARGGSYFVLGNHDLRIKDPSETRRRLLQLGWVDMGGTSRQITVRDTAIEIIGNESPWFPAPELRLTDAADHGQDIFRLLLSHSPDQIEWARRRGVHLMLAGHTHGGQGRLPWIGPVLSPSFYGSRYASGTFHLPPTTMHVTRGLSGVHLMRINCPPELALLTLRSVELQSVE